MALKLDLTGLLGDSAMREAMTAAMPRALAARELHHEQAPRWRRLPQERQFLESCQQRAAEVKAAGPVEVFVVLGIGGSALGNTAMIHALAPVFQEWKPAEGQPRVFVLDNVDPDWLGAFFEDVPLDKAHINVISKSGGTIETSSQFLLAWQHMLAACGGDEAAARARFTLTTDDSNGHFRKIADDLGFSTLSVPDGVGGRFSVLSPVGLFTAVMAGLDAEGLLAGAERVDNKLAAAAPEEDAALMYALAHVLHMEAGRNVHVQFAYSHRLRSMADWFKQLWAESLGKRHNLKGEEVHVGPTPSKAVGPTDQHSQSQLYVEGPDDKVYTILKLDRFEKEVEVPAPFTTSAAFAPLHGRSLNELMEQERRGTEVALLEAGRPVCVLELCKLDAFHVGQYFMMMEIATAYAGHMMGIDPFDQPGVEAGKVAALALMGCEGYEQRAKEIEARFAERTPLILSC